MLFDATKGEFVEEYLYTLPPKKALICAINQHKGNFNTWEYPNDIEGIHKSNCVKGRLLFDIDEDRILYAQEA